MSKRPNKQRERGTPGSGSAPKGTETTSKATPHSGEPPLFSREGVESIIVAILLALLFRGFEAEAFIIPTGSMAPTLQGRHYDIRCPQCQKPFQSGESLGQSRRLAMYCPMCRFKANLDPSQANHSPFNGDRILVNKFIYQFSEPRRWDVIVFKYPGNAKQNFIKRLVGLPGEELLVQSGDVYVRSSGDADFKIARKPADKLQHMLHPVFDTRYIPEVFTTSGWPAAWTDTSNTWTVSEDQTEYELAPGQEPLTWLMYRHLLPDDDDWSDLLAGELPRDLDRRKGSLITDFYAYNAVRALDKREPSGFHWVGDVAGEVQADVLGESGTVALQLVEGGHHITCSIDLSTGAARLSIDDGAIPFSETEPGVQPTELTASTDVRGVGKYRLMWANADDQFFLWVNRRLVAWQSDGNAHPATYTFSKDILPQWSETDPQDLHPVRVGAQSAGLRLSQMRVYRDIYYIAAVPQFGTDDEYQEAYNEDQLRRLFQTPSRWADSRLLRSRRQGLTFRLGDDQFFPMGDNSPKSSDARLWAAPGRNRSHYYKTDDGRDAFVPVGNYIDRKLLIGKAFFVYWPHGWHLAPLKLPVAPVPYLDRMGRIH